MSAFIREVGQGEKGERCGDRRRAKVPLELCRCTVGEAWERRSQGWHGKHWPESGVLVAGVGQAGEAEVLCPSKQL